MYGNWFYCTYTYVTSAGVYDAALQEVQQRGIRFLDGPRFLDFTPTVCVPVVGLTHFLWVRWCVLKLHQGKLPIVFACSRRRWWIFFGRRKCLALDNGYKGMHDIDGYYTETTETIETSFPDHLKKKSLLSIDNLPSMSILVLICE